MKPEPLADLSAWLQMSILQIPSALSVWVMGPARRTLAHQDSLASIMSLGPARLSLNHPWSLYAEVGHKGMAQAQVSEVCEVCPGWQASVYVSEEQSEFGLSTAAGL